MAQVEEMQERINELTLTLPALSGDKLREALNEIHSLNKQIRQIKPVYHGGRRLADPVVRPIDERSRKEMAIAVDRFKQGLLESIAPCESPIERLLGIWMYCHGIPFEAQRQIGKYRVDFCVGSAVIECDGFDYHDRTKEQATRDKQQERELMSLGFTVYRFSGAEIWADPEKCAKEVIKINKGEGKCQKSSG